MKLVFGDKLSIRTLEVCEAFQAGMDALDALNIALYKAESVIESHKLARIGELIERLNTELWELSRQITGSR